MGYCEMQWPFFIPVPRPSAQSWEAVGTSGGGFCTSRRNALLHTA